MKGKVIERERERQRQRQRKTLGWNGWDNRATGIL